MAIIQNTSGKPFDPVGAKMEIDAELLPSFRIVVARQNHVEKNLLVRLTAGMGDNICAEPAIRWALKAFKKVRISIACDYPEIFQHLQLALKDMINTTTEKPELDKYLVFDSLQMDGHMGNEFVAPSFTHCVDYSTLNMWRCQIPMADRCVKLVPTAEQCRKAIDMINPRTDVVIHPGQTWPSRTLPREWWDQVISNIIAQGGRPVLIGGDIVHNIQSRGTVEVKSEGCLDLRNQLSIMESVAVMQLAKVVLTNDSAPLHMAASGDAWIGFLSTVRHPEVVTHYRNGGEFGWRMQNFSKGGLWQSWDMCPSSPDVIRFDMVRKSQLLGWLPDPLHFSTWATSKLGLSDPR